jgi:hypothetical protein
MSVRDEELLCNFCSHSLLEHQGKNKVCFVCDCDLKKQLFALQNIENIEEEV